MGIKWIFNSLTFQQFFFHLISSRPTLFRFPIKSRILSSISLISFFLRTLSLFLTFFLTIFVVLCLLSISSSIFFFSTKQVLGNAGYWKWSWPKTVVSLWVVLFSLSILLLLLLLSISYIISVTFSLPLSVDCHIVVARWVSRTLLCLLVLLFFHVYHRWFWHV